MFISFIRFHDCMPRLAQLILLCLTYVRLFCIYFLSVQIFRKLTYLIIQINFKSLIWFLNFYRF